MAAMLTLCSLLLPAVIGTQSEVRECAFSDHGQQHRAGSLRSANLQQGEERDNSTVRCSRGLACFGLWEQKPGGEVLLLKQGCWTSQPDCLSDHCLVTAPPAHIHKGSYRFCCCSRDLCNTHFRETQSTMPPPAHKLTDGGGLPGNSSALVAVGTVAVAIIAVTLLFCGYTLLTGKKKVSSTSVNVLETTTTPCGDMDDLRLWELIGRGRFASVYRGSLSDRTVAVKVFSPAQRQKYANQCGIYRIPLLRQQHDLAHFLSAHERSDGEGCVQHLIVMDYYPHGCLSHFLSHSCMDWTSCCRMMLGVTRGLSFLHSEVHVGDQSKPAVVHRDVSSSNVLVRSDMTCVLSGFSLSMALSRDPSGGHGDPSSVAISEAGTLRYRAPELLSGALDLREYGTALKQVDVYALGLLFWESFRRCHDLFSGRTAPHFELAFEAELGQELSLEDMHELVAREKYRPQFPPEWKHNSPVLRLLKETMEDCWDQDAEARLSVQCAEERLSQLSRLTVPTSNQSNGCYAPPIPDHVSGAQRSQDQSVTSTFRAKAEQHIQQHQVQRPSSLQLLFTAPSREVQRGPQPRERLGPPQLTAPSKESLGGPQCRERQVETGVAKMNAVAVLARAPVTVTMATNRSAVLMADGSSAGAPTLVTNSLMVRGLTNRAGPNSEGPCRSSQDLTSLEQEPALNLLWSPDEDQPLLKNEVPPAGVLLSAQHSNANNNNNYCSHRDRRTAQRPGHADRTRSDPAGTQLSLLVPTETQPSHLVHLSEDISHYNPDPDVTIEILNCAPSLQPDELKLSCGDEVQMSMCERRDTAVILMDSPKETPDKWNMDIINTKTSEDPDTFRNASDFSSSSSSSVPVSQMSSEHPAGLCLSDVSPAHVPTHTPSSASLSRTPLDLVQSTAGLQRDGRPPRPCSLDLSSPSDITDGALLTDSGLSASGEKIRRRVKTPYTVKKWRPASWVPPVDHHPALLLQASPNCPRIGQSKSSMAVFLLGGGATASTSPDGLTSF